VSKQSGIKTIRTLTQAQTRAQEVANRTGSSVLVYRSLLREDEEDYGTAFTLPSFAERIGERIYPEERQ
jgi:hypothetical protein